MVVIRKSLKNGTSPVEKFIAAVELTHGITLYPCLGPGGEASGESGFLGCKYTEPNVVDGRDLPTTVLFNHLKESGYEPKLEDESYSVAPDTKNGRIERIWIDTKAKEFPEAIRQVTKMCLDEEVRKLTEVFDKEDLASSVQEQCSISVGGGVGRL